MKALLIIIAVIVLAYLFWRGVLKFVGMFSDHVEEVFYDNNSIPSQKDERKAAQP